MIHSSENLMPKKTTLVENKPVCLSEADIVVLQYLNGLLECTAATLGAYLERNGVAVDGKSPVAVASQLFARLRRLGMVVPLRDLGASRAGTEWRITAIGRSALKAHNGGIIH